MNYGFGFPASHPAQQYGFSQPPPPVVAQPFFPPAFVPAQQPPMADRQFFRSWYASGLRALRDISKVVITDLTIAASDWANQHHAIVVQLLDEHIRTVDPSMKLPALYLIDSICKNKGPPYTTSFAQRIDRIFLAAYREVDPATQVKMEELLGTWRTGGPNGTQLFHGRAQQDIEKTLFGVDLRGGGIGGQGRAANEVRHFLSGAQQLPSMASQAERQGVLGDVRKLLGIWEMRKRIEPDNPTPDEQIKALQQLEGLLTTATLTADMVSNIRNEIVNLTPDDTASAADPVAGPSSLPDLNGIDFSALSALLPARTPSSQDQAPVSANDAALALLRALDPNTVSKLTGSSSSSARTVTDGPEVDYEDLVLKMDLKLTPTDIARYRPTAPDLLYDRLPLQCQQCGARFLESPRGHAKLGAHTDRHFRHKKRLREAARAQSRSWFASEEDWITPPARLVLPEAAPEQAVKVEEKPLGKVKVPKDPARSARPCPICKDPFKSEFNEAEEDFVWLDAVEADGLIYHDSCRREAMKSRVLSKAAVSREGTPASIDGRGSTPVPGKRKAIEAVPEAEVEPDAKRVKAEDIEHDL